MQRLPQLAVALAVSAFCGCVAAPARAQTQSPPASPKASPAPAAAAPVPVTPTTSFPTTAAQAAASGRAGTDATPTPVTQPTLPGMPTPAGHDLDRVVAIVNGDLILDSDVDQDLRLDELEPYGESNRGQTTARTRSRSIERLINRDLILQQAKIQPDPSITDAAVDKELDALRKNIPACKQYHCETEAGWHKLLAAYGFTVPELHQLWKQRMIVLSFIEQRFRMGIRVSPTEIKTYYTNTLLPQYDQLHATPPPLDAISDRIQEVLLEQRVSQLLNSWLDQLRAQGSIVVLHPGEDAP
jgi:peptidyl-prolyl cis-trans isomerase SurA